MSDPLRAVIAEELDRAAVAETWGSPYDQEAAIDRIILEGSRPYPPICPTCGRESTGDQSAAILAEIPTTTSAGDDMVSTSTWRME